MEGRKDEGSGTHSFLKHTERIIASLVTTDILTLWPQWPGHSIYFKIVFEEMQREIIVVKK